VIFNTKKIRKISKRRHINMIKKTSKELIREEKEHLKLNVTDQVRFEAIEALHREDFDKERKTGI
jgi:hypothetical protein